MTAWTNLLVLVVKASSHPGDLSAPTSLLELSESLEDPLTTLSGRDTERSLFEALDEDLSFIRPVRSLRQTISQTQKEKLARSIRWLVGNLSDWSQIGDPNRARLVAMIVMAARLDENGALWLLMHEKIIQNDELAQELRNILGRLRFRAEAANFSRSPIVDREQIEELAAAEAEQNWPALRAFAEKAPWRFQSNAILDQSVRVLNRFFPHCLVESGRAVSQIGLAMQMITAISVTDALRFAADSENHMLQFAAVCRFFVFHDRVSTLDSEQEGALVVLLYHVAKDTGRWSAWMQAFAAHPYQTTLIQPAIGLCLAISDEAALQAYIDAVCLQASWVGREQVKACLCAFANGVSLERRRAAWKLAFARWSAWNFGEHDGLTTPTGIAISNMDFAIVGYAKECLSPEELEAHITGCLDRVREKKHVWHASQLNYMHAVYRALSWSQPFLHASVCGTEHDNWLWNKTDHYLFDEFESPYCKIRYGLHITSVV